MSYTPTTWTTGDTITATAMNKIENGIANAGGMMVIITDGAALDKTWQEIYDALAEYKMCALFNVSQNNAEVGIVLSVYEDGNYYVATTTGNFVTSTTNGYPVLD